MREDIRWEANNIAEDFHRIICLICEYVDIVVAIAEEKVVLQCAIYDRDLS